MCRLFGILFLLVAITQSHIIANDDRNSNGSSKGVVLQDVYWRDYKDGIIPSDAVPTGNNIYIGQTIHRCTLPPGTIYPESEMFISEHDGKIEAKNNIKILCSGYPSRFKWEFIDVNNLPGGLMNRLVEGGYENEIRFYIGRTYHQNEWRIGKVDLFDWVRMWMWNNDGSTHSVYQFDILTYV